MITISIPEFKEELNIEHLVLDFNSLVSIDGTLIVGVKERLQRINQQLKIHIITGNSFGAVAELLKDIPCRIILLQHIEERVEKVNYLKRLNSVSVISIGNIDEQFLKSSAIGITIIQDEDSPIENIIGKQMVSNDILSALDIVKNL